ncbi:pilus assembly protein PilV [Pseudomonas taeanensis MS-3]|jgi:type IV pilus assembly protein PilV|uniref:Pilus assembly protein PilV n=1 Tax=Pseudomonas taeanensis MS-3 TaxID=1395571 RepID=A0A0A1YRB5_9PSED|nr:type IV pilus modification protein PilV [Pseudomonas taeanensis]KFX71634.1 pilus assembly protein PilV [Pseudomonas taeanensis MS-3]
MINARQSAGFSLIEVLVSFLVLSIGVLGMAGLQLNALKFNQTAAVRSQATFLAYDIAERMRANRVKARSGNYDIALTAGAPSGTSIEATDLQQWRAALTSQLPDGKGAVARNASKVIVTVQWDESRVGGQSSQQFVYETQL